VTSAGAADTATVEAGKEQLARACKNPPKGLEKTIPWRLHRSTQGCTICRVFDEISFHETGYETIFLFRENEGRVSRVSQFRETADITKETSLAKNENRESKETWSKKT
jgi:hypothetical protein